MIRKLTFATAFALNAAVASAQSATELVTLDTRQSSQGWEAVGRLNISGNGFCTAALIRDRLLLTAAHCVYDANNDLIPADQFVFQAGLRNGRAEATRNIIRIVAHPDYVPDGPTARVDGVQHDIAVLELAQPIRYSGVQPFPIAARPFAGDDVAIVSYGKNRAEAPSLQETCSILGRQSGALVMDCDVESGSSGSPVFRIQNGRAQIVSVVSAVAEASGNKISLGTSLQEPLQILLAEFAARGPAKPGGEQRMIQIGDQNDTGAKFISVN